MRRLLIPLGSLAGPLSAQELPYSAENIPKSIQFAGGAFSKSVRVRDLGGESMNSTIDSTGSGPATLACLPELTGVHPLALLP